MKISVALCTYNGARHLAQQLESIFQQTNPVHEIIICDDGSQDETVAIIHHFQATWPGIIQLHQNKSNLGVKQNFEKAISLTAGEIIFLSDQDDTWLPHKVTATLRFFESHPAATALFSNGRLIDEQGKNMETTIWQNMGFSEKLQNDITPENLFEFLMRFGNVVTGAALCIKREAFDYLFPFFCPANYWHDYWIALAAAYKNGLYFLREELILYRIHISQQVGLPSLTSDYNQQNEIKEMQWLGWYDKLNTERFLQHNLSSRKRINLFAPKLRPLSANHDKIEILNATLQIELEIIKQNLFSEMGFLGRKKLALIAIAGRQKTLNMNRSDILKLLFS